MHNNVVSRSSLCVHRSELVLHVLDFVDCHYPNFGGNLNLSKFSDPLVTLHIVFDFKAASYTTQHKYGLIFT